MLEWYRPGPAMGDLIEEAMALLRAVLPPARDLAGRHRFA